MSQPHKWLLKITPQAKGQFDKLPAGRKRSIFVSLWQLLNAENPYSLGFIEKLQDPKFANKRKFRSGNYRIFVDLDTRAITHQKHQYKGTLFIIAIRHRGSAY